MQLINRVDIDSDNQALTRKLLAKTARQAQGRCLGSEGIRLLAYTLQNELIAQGYITSLIDVPSQSLEHGILRFTLHYGKVGAIDYADGSDTTRLWNSLPTSSGTILRLSDLEQGMANLQRLPGATAHMKLLPGQHEGESDIQIARSLAKKWQLGAWLDDAGSKASGRYQAGGALYLYDLTNLNDILYLSGGGDIEFNQHNDGNHNGSLYYSIPFGYWTLSAYGAYSQYRQQFNGNWSTMDYKSKNRYYSATLSRLLSHTRQQKTTADLRIAKSTSHYYFGGSELLVMRKQNPSWEFTLNHQHYFNKKIVDASIGIQRSLPWLSSTATPEEQAGLYSPLSRIVHGNPASNDENLTHWRQVYTGSASAPSSARTNSLPITNSILVVAGACAVLTVKTACPAIRDGTGATIDLSGDSATTRAAILFGRGYKPVSARVYQRQSVSPAPVFATHDQL